MVMRFAIPGFATWGRRLLGGVAALAMALSSSSSGATALEYQVKAAYLYKLVPFVDWPPGALPPGAALNLCIVGDDPFGVALDQLSESRPVDGRQLVVRRLAVVTRQSGCHILYIAGSKSQSVANALQTVQGLPSLTITDGPQAPGSVVQFVISESRVRFTVNIDAASQNGLTISSKLLSLALAVRGRPSS